MGRFSKNRWLAHTPTKGENWHYLDDHLESVAKLAAQFASKFHSQDYGRIAGLLHDVGKAGQEFRTYLEYCYQNPEKKIRGPDHSSVGAILAAQHYWEGLAFIVAGHHAGLPKPSDLSQRLQVKQRDPDVQKILAAAKMVITLPKSPAPPPITSPLQCDLFLRMLFSSLVDADYLDTEKHFNPLQSQLRSQKYHIGEMFAALEQKLAQFSGKDQTPVNKARHEILQYCLEAASLEPGFFRLTVPTGGGKTLSGLAFALKHACIYNRQRIIVAIPYTSIIDQTAQVYGEIFGQERLVEHHSAINLIDEEQDFVNLQWSRLAAENWDAPLIVTTTVQLFESLFAHRPAACRKLHNLVESIIFLDEVQTLPSGLLEPILEVLEQLVDSYGVSVIFSTATQPALTEAESPFMKAVRGHVREIVPSPGGYFQALNRVTYELPLEKWSWEKVAAETLTEPQCLVIVNTKSDALALLKHLADAEVFHLSTLLCTAHRRKVLQAIKRRLAAGKPCLVVATQVVESGVDLDFPVVFRAIGPLDRIVQAAGRCNREGKLKQGKVVVFVPAEGKMPPGDYQSGTDLTAAILKNSQINLNTPELYTSYFQRVYQAVETDKQGINKLREQLNFPKVDRKFRMIEDDTVPLVVHYPRDNSPAGLLLSRIKNMDCSQFGEVRQLYRLLQPYLINVRQCLLGEYQQQGLIQELPLGLWEWLGDYHEVWGLWDKTLDPEKLVV